MATWRILEGDCVTSLRDIDAESVQTCITSPPYFGLRDYGHEGQIGLEPTPDEFVAALVAVFREVRRVLRDDGTVWLNLGDSYAGSGKGPSNDRPRPVPEGIKGKDLLGIPWLVAFALRADGWYLRSDIIWSKPNPMPESVTDRPTKAHEYLFLLSKSARYFYDADAIREDKAESSTERYAYPRHGNANKGTQGEYAVQGSEFRASEVDQVGRNKRSVWTVATQSYTGAHFATFPPKLIEPCILAGCPESGTVLDPFTGSGTTGMVALRHGRSFVGVELNPAYAQLARDRITADAPLLNAYAEVA